MYAARFRLPADLAAKFGVTEVRRSLHTADPREARARCLRATVWFRDTVEILRAMDAPTKSDLEAAARTFFEEEVRVIDARRPFEDDSGGELEFNIEETANRIESVEYQLKSKDFDRLIRTMAVQLMLRAGHSDADDVTMEARQIAARVERQQLLYLLHSLTKPWTPFEPDDPLGSPLLATTVPSASTAENATAGFTVNEAIQRFLDRKRISGVGSSQLDEVARALSWLEEHLGRDTALSVVTKPTMRAFRDGLERLDRRLQGKGGYKFQDRQTGNKEHWIASATATRHWRATQSLFGWAVVENDLKSDPTAGLKIAQRKDDVNHTPPPFTAEELQKLFKSPLFAGHKSPKQPLVPGACRERGAYWWSGIIALYTGMRAGEIAQLLTTDFDFTAKIPVIHVRKDDGAGGHKKLVKTDSSVRDIPIAAPLLVLGLAQFVNDRRKRFKIGRLFPEIRLGQKDHTSDGMTKFWGRVLRDAGVHKDGRSVHVFRHTTTAAMRAAKIPEELIGAVLGHTPSSITGQYGGAFPASRLVEAIDALDFGFDVIKAVGGAYSAQVHKA